MNDMTSAERNTEKFRRRLERISRRRFLKLSALSGAASFGLVGANPGAVAQDPLPCEMKELSPGDRCRMTRTLMSGNSVEQVFRSLTFKELLQRGKGQFSGCAEQFLNKVIERLPGNKALRDFYTEDIEGHYEGLSAALDDAEKVFSIPFRVWGLDRDEAKLLLGGDKPEFIEIFGRHWIGNFIEKGRDQIDRSDEDVLDRAHRAGLFRAIPPYPIAEGGEKALADSQCARKTNGVWRCEDAPEGKCSIVDNTPSAGTAVCP